MIVCILWQHRLAIRHVHPQRGLFFAPEADSVLGDYAKEGRVAAAAQRHTAVSGQSAPRAISRRHGRALLSAVLEKIDLFYTFDETGFNQYTLYQRPRVAGMLNDQRLSEPCGDPGRTVGNT